MSGIYQPQGSLRKLSFERGRACGIVASMVCHHVPAGRQEDKDKLFGCLTKIFGCLTKIFHTNGNTKREQLLC